MTDQVLLCLWCLFLLAALALLIRYDERSWGEVSALGLLLAFIAIPSIAVALVTFLQPVGVSTIVAALLLLVSLAALVTGSLSRWTGAMAVLSLAAFLVAIPPTAMVAL